MNLLDNTQNQIKNITKTLLRPIKTLLEPSNISYGFIGLTTVLLGYYTFFENDIENPLPDTLASPQSESTASSLNPFASSQSSTASSDPSTASSLNPFASSNPSDEKPIISGGKKYQRKTNKYKYR